jgi:hypothetical protein
VTVADAEVDVPALEPTVPTDPTPENAAAPHVHPEAPPVGIAMLVMALGVKPEIDHIAIRALPEVRRNN